ncbi:glycosyltransferase domain-containing protein [Nocardioides sp.]|uniref:glycosyltransferase domain-containing protein n=1 Tax=Nocardioides sp. TaxID=35761 RepID=UPI0039E6A175
MTRRVVYTALIGSYEKLWEQPTASDSEIEFVCFTDNPELRSDTWRIEPAVPLLPEDPIRSARHLKIVGHPLLADVEETLWLDARVVLKVDPAAILDEWLAGSDLTLPCHSFRPSVVAEFAEVIRMGLDDPARIHEQLNHYALEGTDRLQRLVPWTAIIARRHTAAVERAMAEWMRHVWRYSRRDQLSFVEAMARAELPTRLVDLPNLESDLHRWPAGVGRDERVPAWKVAESLLAPVIRVGVLELELERATRAMSTSLEQREDQLQALESQVRDLTEQLGQARAHADELRGEVARHHQNVVDLHQELSLKDEKLARRQRRIRKLRAEIEERDAAPAGFWRGRR